MSWSDFEILQCLGDYGLSVSLRYDLLKFVKPGGFREPAVLTGHSEGQLGFALRFETLSKAIAQGLDPGEQFGGLQSRADYLWAFYQRSKRAGDKPFIIEFDLPGQAGTRQILCVFAEDQLSYTLFAARLFSTGLALEQARVEGFALEDVQAGNPQQI